MRMLKRVASFLGTFMPGDVKDVPDELAVKWLKAGLVMQDKSLDGGKETKEVKHGNSSK